MLHMYSSTGNIIIIHSIKFRIYRDLLEEVSIYCVYLIFVLTLVVTIIFNMVVVKNMYVFA